jgi:hypothetical protein
MAIRKDKIDPAITKEIDSILQKSAGLFQQRDLQGALAVAQKAWDLIPNPKNKWDYYPQSLSSGFVEDFTELRDVDAMRKWIAVTYEMSTIPAIPPTTF